MSRNFATIALLSTTALFTAAANAEIRITEWMYSGTGGEFVEFTNVGNTAIDMTGWVYDDDSRVTTAFGGALDLSAFGIVNPGESVIITEDAAATFRTAWGLDASIKIIGGYTNNLGRNDEINIYDNNQQLIDRLTYGDQTFAGSLRTQEISGNLPLLALGTNDPFAAVASFVGDSYGSWASTNGDVGNPGLYTPIPAPAALAFLGVGAAFGRRRRRSN